MASASKLPKASESARIPVLLLRNKKSKSILYMEAGKEFVDLLLSFLTLPTGTVLKLLSQTEAVGAINNIFDSVKQLQASTFYVDKDVLLDQKPVCPAASSAMTNVLAIESAEAPVAGGHLTYYSCACSHPCGLLKYDIRDGRQSYCPQCRRSWDRATRIVFIDDGCPAGYTTSAHSGSTNGRSSSTSTSTSGKPGFVKKSLTYSITDDLHIRPASTINSIALLSELKVETMSELESFKATVGPRELSVDAVTNFIRGGHVVQLATSVMQALQLLQCSLCSKTALNDVFGPKATSKRKLKV